MDCEIVFLISLDKPWENVVINSVKVSDNAGWSREPGSSNFLFLALWLVPAVGSESFSKALGIWKEHLMYLGIPWHPDITVSNKYIVHTVDREPRRMALLSLGDSNMLTPESGTSTNSIEDSPLNVISLGHKLFLSVASEPWTKYRNWFHSKHRAWQFSQMYRGSWGFSST